MRRCISDQALEWHIFVPKICGMPQFFGPAMSHAGTSVRKHCGNPTFFCTVMCCRSTWLTRHVQPVHQYYNLHTSLLYDHGPMHCSHTHRARIMQCRWTKKCTMHHECIVEAHSSVIYNRLADASQIHSGRGGYIYMARVHNSS